MSAGPVAAVAEADDPEVPSPSVGPSKPRLLRVLGPGLIAGASDDDPSGIATYSQAGAQLGFGLCWTMLYTLPLMAAVQMVSLESGAPPGAASRASCASTIRMACSRPWCSCCWPPTS